MSQQNYSKIPINLSESDFVQSDEKKSLNINSALMGMEYYFTVLAAHYPKPEIQNSSFYYQEAVSSSNEQEREIDRDREREREKP